MDEMKKDLNFEKLKPSFRDNGRVTPGNASPISDGAAMVVLSSREKAKEMNWEVLATISSFAHAEQASLEFSSSPALAINKALDKAKLKIEQVDFVEINEAFAVVGIVNQRLLSLKDHQLNPFGGSIALGHPVGCSGTRIIVTLINALIQENKTTGVAGICNGGGGATSIVLQRKP